MPADEDRHRMRFWPRWWPRRAELADALGALEETRAELAGARERIAELEARSGADVTEFVQAAV